MKKPTTGNQKENQKKRVRLSAELGMGGDRVGVVGLDPGVGLGWMYG